MEALFVKEYIGTKIYLSLEHGWFFCNTANIAEGNSANRTHRSKVLGKLEQAIRVERCNAEDTPYLTVMHKFTRAIGVYKIVSRNGNYVIVENGAKYKLGHDYSSYAYIGIVAEEDKQKFARYRQKMQDLHNEAEDKRRERRKLVDEFVKWTNNLSR